MLLKEAHLLAYRGATARWPRCNISSNEVHETRRIQSPSRARRRKPCCESKSVILSIPSRPVTACRANAMVRSAEAADAAESEEVSLDISRKAELLPPSLRREIHKCAYEPLRDFFLLICL